MTVQLLLLRSCAVTAPLELCRNQKELTMTKRYFHVRTPIRQLLNRQRGLSLIPVMVSIAIFTAIAVQYNLPKQQQQQQQDRLHSAQITAGQILQAAINHYIDNGNWPPDINTLVNAGRLDIANTNPWGNPWRFEVLPTGPVGGAVPPNPNYGITLVTQTGNNQAAIALAARFGGIARVCNEEMLCVATEAGGTWVHIGIAPP